MPGTRAHMGLAFGKMMYTMLGWKTEVRVLVLGLDNAGKTTILYQLKLGEVVSTIPTIGFNVETVTYKNLTFQVWDLGGQSSIRPYWRCYYQNTQAIIYVVDSTDTDRLDIAKQELHAMLAEEELKETKLCVFANKQDVAGALAEADISAALGLASLKSRTWTIFKTSAIKGEGVTDGLEWLTSQIVA